MFDSSRPCILRHCFIYLFIFFSILIKKICFLHLYAFVEFECVICTLYGVRNRQKAICVYDKETYNESIGIHCNEFYILSQLLQWSKSSKRYTITKCTHKRRQWIAYTRTTSTWNGCVWAIEWVYHLFLYVIFMKF